MTLHIAVDSVPQVALPSGKIVGIARSVQGLRDAGFAASTYTGNRVSSIDETADGVWDNNCEPGWFLVNGNVQQAEPRSALEKMQDALSAFLTQCDDWENGLNAQATGQPATKVAIGHDYLWRARGGAYLIGNDTTLTAAEREAWAKQAIFGAADITSVASFYMHFRGTGVSNWITWVQIDRTANPKTFTRVNLANAIAVSGTIPDNIVLALHESGIDQYGRPYTGWVRSIIA